MSDDLSALIREAEVLYSQRDWDAALEKYQRVMSLDPSNDEACEKLARVYAIRGQIQQVIATYFQLMDILEERGENDIAIEVARWIMKLQPESDRARMRQIQIFMKKGDRDEVMRQSLELARLYIELGQGDQSIDLLKNAQEMDPENLDIGVELAEMYIRQGHIQDGANQFRKIANTFLDQGKLEKAADAFKRMKLIQPDDPSLLFTLGNIYVNLGKLNEAEAEFRSILRHDLNHLEALMALGNVCQAKGQFRDAILAFNKILSINPQEITAKEKLGELYQAQGNVNEAIKNYLSAAHTYQFEEDVERAVRLYQRVVALDPTNPTACRELTNMGAPLQAAPEDLEPSAFQPVMAPVGEISIPQPGMPEGSDLPAGVVPMDDEGGLTGRGGASPAARTPRGLTSKAGGSGAGKATLPRAGMMTPRGAGLVPKSEGGGGATAGGKKAMGGDSRPTLARSRTSEVSGAKPQLMRGRETDVEMPPIEEEMGYAPQPEMEAPAYPEEPVGQEQGEAEALEQDYVAPEAPQAFTEPPETFEVPTFDPSVLADAAPPPMPAEAAAPVEFPAFDEAPPMPDAEAVHEEPPPEAAWPQPPAAELAASAAPVSPIIESRPSLIRGLTRKSEGTPSGRSVIHEGTSGGRGMGQEGAPGGRGMIKKGGPEPVAEEQSARGLTRKSAPVPEPEPDAEEAGGPRLFSRGGGGGLRKPLRGRLEMPARGGEHGPETHEEPAEAVPMHEAPPMPEMAAPPLPEAAAPGATAAPPDVFAAPEMPPMPYETVEAAAPAEVSAWSETVADSDQAAYEPAIDESPVVAAAAEPPTEAAGVGAGEPPPGGEAQAVEQPAAQPAPAPPRPRFVPSAAEPSFEVSKLEEYLGANDMTRALLAFRKSLQENPSDLEMRGRLADTLFACGMVEEAAIEYMSIARVDPENPDSLHRLVETFLWSDEPDRAVPLLIHLSKMHAHRDEVDEAFQALQDALTVQRENAQARWELAELFSQFQQQELANWHLRVMADIADEHNDADAAIETYRKLLQMTGDPVDQERLAQVLEKYGRVDEAVEAWRALAQRWRSEGADDRARAIYEKVTELSPNDLATHEALLNLYRDIGDEEKAGERMRILARVARETGDLDRSLQLHEEIVKRNPDDVEARKSLVGLYLDKGLFDNARTEAGGLLEAWYKENRTAEAIALLGRFIEAAPDDVSVRDQLIHFHERAGDTDSALAERLRLARVHVGRGANDEALKAFQKALAMDERNPEVHYQLGLMYADHFDDPQEAERHLLKVKEYDPKHKEAMKRLVNIQLKLNKPREAIQMLQDLIKEAPENAAIRDEILAEYKKRVQDHTEDAQSRFTLGVLYKELKLLDHAIEQFQETRKVKDLLLASYNMLGTCFAEKKGFNMEDLAIKQFKKGLETKGYGDEEYLELRYNLAELYNRRNEVDEALKLYQDIYIVDVGYRDVAEKIKQLQGERDSDGKITRLPPRDKAG